MADITIHVYTIGMVSTNCYVICNEHTKEAVVIDPADDADKLISYLKKDGLVIKGILLTHGHFDHILAAKELKEQLGVKIYAHKAEKELLADGYKNCSSNMGGKSFTLVPDVLLEDNEIVMLGDMKIKVIHTPGHTAGGVCYYFFDNAIIVSGDTLFKDSVGRTDLPTSDTTMLLESIREKLMILSEEIMVLPGHGKPTTIGYEKKNNMYF